MRGFYYWTLVDNFEWNAGYLMEFGLYAWRPDGSVDRKLKEGAKALVRGVEESSQLWQGVWLVMQGREKREGGWCQAAPVFVAVGVKAGVGWGRQLPRKQERAGCPVGRMGPVVWHNQHHSLLLGSAAKKHMHPSLLPMLCADALHCCCCPHACPSRCATSPPCPTPSLGCAPPLPA